VGAEGAHSVGLRPILACGGEGGKVRCKVDAKAEPSGFDCRWDFFSGGVEWRSGEGPFP